MFLAIWPNRSLGILPAVVLALTVNCGGSIGGAGGNPGEAGAPSGGALGTGGTGGAGTGGAMNTGGSTLGDSGGTGEAGGGAEAGTGGSTATLACDAYERAASNPDGLLEACKLASNSCYLTLAEYLGSQVAGDVIRGTTSKVNLVEGCGTRSVGWDARLGGSVLTYDSNNQLIGYYMWDDIPHGPCANRGYPYNLSYALGSSRKSLLKVSDGCASDVVCIVPMNADESLLHCTVL